MVWIRTRLVSPQTPHIPAKKKCARIKKQTVIGLDGQASSPNTDQTYCSVKTLGQGQAPRLKKQRYGQVVGKIKTHAGRCTCGRQHRQRRAYLPSSSALSYGDGHFSHRHEPPSGGTPAQCTLTGPSIANKEAELDGLLDGLLARGGPVVRLSGNLQMDVCTSGNAEPS